MTAVRGGGGGCVVDVGHCSRLGSTEERMPAGNRKMRRTEKKDRTNINTTKRLNARTMKTNGKAKRCWATTEVGTRITVNGQQVNCLGRSAEAATIDVYAPLLVDWRFIWQDWSHFLVTNSDLTSGAARTQSGGSYSLSQVGLFEVEINVTIEK